MIYLDYAANTPSDPLAQEAFIACEKDYIANPNSNHPLGIAARDKMTEITAHIASLLGVDPGTIIYTSGASEANNTAIKGIARTSRHAGKHIISTALEHPSVSAPLTYLQEQGYEIDLVDIRQDGKIDTDHLRELMRKDTVLIAVTAVDSELGTIQPIDEILKIKQDFPQVRIHVDATQAIGKIPFSFAGIDTVSFTAHKFYGPNGIGVLYKASDLVLEPLIHGGSGSSLYRSGTPTLSLAASLDAALDQALEKREERSAYIAKLNAFLREKLASYKDVRINSPADAVPHILNLSVTGIKGTQFRDALGARGVCVSVKSACSTDGTPSRAVMAVSRDRRNATSSWRISLSHLTTEEELTGFIDAFDNCYKELKS